MPAPSIRWRAACSLSAPAKRPRKSSVFRHCPKNTPAPWCWGETEPGPAADISHLTRETIEQAAAHFTGRIEQTPPLYSAIKVDGRRAYHHARAGDKVTLKSRPVEIHSFAITRVALPEVDFHVKCSKGLRAASGCRRLPGRPAQDRHRPLPGRRRPYHCRTNQ